jgi:hypothetical protein
MVLIIQQHLVMVVPVSFVVVSILVGENVDWCCGLWHYTVDYCCGVVCCGCTVWVVGQNQNLGAGMFSTGMAVIS